MIENNRFEIIKKLVQEYDFKIPLSRYLKSFFQKNRKMGSRDRRIVSSFIFNYYRTRNLFQDFSLEEKICLSNYLFADSVDQQLEHALQLVNFSKEDLPLDINEKLNLIQSRYKLKSIGQLFPFSSPLSQGITREEMEQSYFKRPITWIRCREQFSDTVKEELTAHAISFNTSNNSLAIGLTTTVDLTSLSSFKKGYFEIQDLSSQKVGDYFKPNDGEYWWDCCAGSGGKSLLLNEQANELKLFVTDIRESTLINLKERFNKTGIKNYQLEQRDLRNENLKLPTDSLFDGITADVPCSGSGTWSRTPEMLTGFNEQSLTSYSELQFKIIKNVLPFLKTGMPLIYITCSVFKSENENVIERLTKELNLKLEESKLINGSQEQADSMFVARLVKH